MTASASAESVDLPHPVAAKLGSDPAEQLREDVELAKAPVARRGFGYSYRFEGTDAGTPFTVSTTVTYERLPEEAFVLEHKLTGSDGLRRETWTYFAAAGLLPVLEISEMTKPDGRKIALEVHLVRYAMSGDLFPVAVGNEFSIEWETRGLMNLKMVGDCTVERSLSAAEFHSQLSGAAFQVLCRNELGGQLSGTRTYYYIQELNHFVPSFRDSECKECKGFRLTLE